MKFKNNICIHCYLQPVGDSTQWLLNMLTELGYKGDTEHIGTTLGVKYDGTFHWINNKDDTDYYDCGYNAELFLALAAMRDDSDKYQLFVSDTSCSWVNLGMWRNKGDFFFCLIDDYYMGENKQFTNCIPPAHKADIEEVKDYFLKNPNYKPYRHWYLNDSKYKNGTNTATENAD